MSLNVYSEIGRLREVLVHAPGAEVDTMPPSMMSELLFDDIIYGPHAREEHARFGAIMERLGVEVLDTQRLLEEAIEVAREHVPALVSRVGRLDGLQEATVEELLAMAPRELARTLVEGLEGRPEERTPDSLFRLPPIPNLLFSRDSQVVLGKGVIISAMRRRARQREPVLSRFLFDSHPRFRGDEVLIDFSERVPGQPWQQNSLPTIEGGDIMIFQEGVVIAGISERTMELAVDLLAQRLRAVEAFHTLIMVPMPRMRSAMHLDTIFTRVSQDQCLVYPPMVLPGSRETLSVISIDLRRSDDWGSRRPSLLDALRLAGVDLKPICCGGPDDYIQQAREQWTDGANSFAVSPGVVMIYSRNAATAEEFSKHGYDVVAAAEMEFSQDGRCLHEFVKGKQYAILVAGGELSRARGGPRCMTMPLRRDAWRNGE